MYGKVSLEEAPKKTQEEYLQLYFIPYLQSERIPVFSASVRRPITKGKIYQQFPHIKFPIGEVTRLYNMFGLENTGSGLNLGNMDYHQ